jgi:hypothetical protein
MLTTPEVPVSDFCKAWVEAREFLKEYDRRLTKPLEGHRVSP